MNHIPGNGINKNNSNSSSNTENDFLFVAPEPSSRGNSTSTSSFVMVEVPQNTTNPMGTIEDESGIEDSPRFGHFSPVNENSYSSSDEYENPGNIYSISDPTSSERNSPSLELDTILEKPRSLHLVLEHLHELHSPNNINRYSRILFGEQQPENAPFALKELIKDNLILLQEAINNSQNTKILSYKLKVYITILIRQYSTSANDLLRYINDHKPEVSHLLNARLLKLLNRFTRIQYDYPICKRRISYQIRNTIKNQSSEDVSLYTPSEGMFSSINEKSEKQPQLSVKDELDDASALESHILSQPTINKLTSSPLNEIIDSIIVILNVIVTVSNPTKNLPLVFEFEAYIKQNLIKISKILDNKLIDFFMYLDKRGVNPNGRSLLFHLIIGLREKGLVPQNPDEQKLQELYEVLSQIRSKFENYMVPDEDLYRKLDKIILYFNKLFVSDFHNELTQRMSWLGFDNTQSLGTVHPIQEILRKRIEDLTRIGQLKIVKGIAKQETSPVQLLITRLLDLKADAKGNYIIPEGLKFTIRQLYNDNTQLVTDLVEQGISQGLTNELIAQATQHLELVDNQSQAEPPERKNETSEDNE